MIKILLFLLLPFILFAEKPKLFLLKTYKDQNINGWVMSEKLDGIRAYWDGKKLISRGGKTIYSPEYFTKGFPSFELDGELWSKRGDFDTISSIVRDKIPSKEWREITYNIFEVPNAKGGLAQRLKKAEPFQSKIIKIISQIKIKSTKKMKIFLKSVELKGGEGIVVRDPKVGYIAKRTSKALKVKSFLDTDCIVIGYTEGKGKYKNMLGALKCKLSNGVVFKIGSGFSDKERQNPPAIGSEITFKYQELTKKGIPRFPIFLRVKNAK